MDTAHRTRWQVYDITLTTSEHTYYAREIEPDRALHHARWKLRWQASAAHPDNDVDDEHALNRLVAGETLTARCRDGEILTVGPITL